MIIISDLILVQSKWNRQNQLRIQPKGIYPNTKFFPLTILYVAYEKPHTVWLISLPW